MAISKFLVGINVRRIRDGAVGVVVRLVPPVLAFTIPPQAWVRFGAQTVPPTPPAQMSKGDDLLTLTEVDEA